MNAIAANSRYSICEARCLPTTRRTAIAVFCFCCFAKRQAGAAQLKNAVVRIKATDEIKVRRKACAVQHVSSVAAHRKNFAGLYVVVCV